MRSSNYRTIAECTNDIPGLTGATRESDSGTFEPLEHSCGLAAFDRFEPEGNART